VEAAPARPPATHHCAASSAPGPIAEPPAVEVASLAKDDRGRPELVLRVDHDGDLFCYRYALDGVTRNLPPVLRMHQGDRFDLRIVNELAGPAPGANMQASQLPRCHPAAMPDVMTRHFVGYLNHPTLLQRMSMPPVDVNMHLHGFEGAAEEENVFLSTLSTSAHACEFAIDIPNTQPPGTYFYHPHAHGAAEHEVGGGLSGMWIVDARQPDLPRADEHAIILTYRYPIVFDSAPMYDDDNLYFAGMAHEVSLKPAPQPSYDPFNPPLWPSSIPLRADKVMLHGSMCGDRPGVWTAVDGVSAPATMTLPSNEPQLLRILNATTDSIEYLHLRDSHGRVLPLNIVARDGIAVGTDALHPLAQYESSMHTELIPGGRVDVLVRLTSGEDLTLFSDPHCNGPFDEVQINRNLLVVHGGEPAALSSPLDSKPIAPVNSSAAALARYVQAHPSNVHKRAFTYTEYPLPNMKGKGGDIEYLITETDNTAFREAPFWPTYSPGISAPKPDVVVKQGSVEEWYIFNATLETHSFHIHQMTFVALDAPDAPAALDTVVLSPATRVRNPKNPDYPLLKPSRTRVLLDFRSVPPGTFVFHCHMLHHEDRGMMQVVRVQ
jgi:FtsP/CotA-like multicopper oxidase with cupredoxin domain